MRTHTAEERTAIASGTPSHSLRVEVQHGDGSWVDYTSYVVSGTWWGEERDQPVGGGVLLLHRGVGTRSLAPTMAGSLLNRIDSGGTFAPAIDIGRAVRFYTTVGPDGEREVFTGRIDDVSWESDPVQVRFSDLGGWLMDTMVEDETEYGSALGTLLETVMQEIVTDWPSGATAVPTLYTPTSPAYYRTTFTQSRVKVLEAIRTLGLNIGYDVRYRYDAAHESRLTLMDPDRERETVDATFTPSEYHEISRLGLSLEAVRNAGVVLYRDATTGEALSATAEDAASISQHGRRWFLIGEQEGIDTESEAQTLVDAAVADMAGPGAVKSVSMLYFWPAQLFDRYTFEGDGVRFDEDQTLAVAGYRHEYVGGAIVTTLTGTTRLVGAYAEWRRRIVDLTPDTVPPSLDVIATPGESSYSIAWSAALGTVELSIDGGTYATAPASPIVVARPAAGELPLSYAFRLTLDGQTVSNEVTVPAIDQDTVTPDLTVSPGTMTDTTATYVVSASNPQGGTAPTITVTFIGTTGTVAGTPVAADTPTTAANGATVVADRPAFGTSAQATLRVVASLSGGGAETIQRTVLNQVKTSFGPSLEVTPTPGTSSYSLAYTYTGTVTLSIDGGSYSTPAASPIVVSRTSADQVYTFKAVLDGQTVVQAVTVPAASAANPAIGSVTTYNLYAPGDGVGGSFDVSWSDVNMPTGTTYDVDWTVTAGSGGSPSSGTAANVSSGVTISAPLNASPSPAVNVVVKAQFNGSTLAMGAYGGLVAI